MNATEIDTTRLEDLLGEKCKCESPHKYVHICSSKVTHRIISCNLEIMVCFIQAKNSVERRNHRTCSGCFRPAKDCWTIIPV